MIPKPIRDITLADIEDLREIKRPEGVDIDYKLALPGPKDRDKVEFLCDVCAFANTDGGDLVFGVKEKDLIPIDFPGVQLTDLDVEISRLDNIIRTGIQPRLSGSVIQHLALANGNHIIVVRVERSWNSPHRVTANEKFYGRGGVSRYTMNIEQLRNSFLMQETAIQRMRDFVADRQNKIRNYETEVELTKQSIIIFHVVPLSAFTASAPIDINSNFEILKKIRPIGDDERMPRRNLEGTIAVSNRRENPLGYVQFFRRGIIESVDIDILGRSAEDNVKRIASLYFEREIVEVFREYILALQELGLNPPFYAFLSLFGVEGYYLAVKDRYDQQTYNRFQMILPEAVYESFDQNADEVMKEILDIFWNAFGYAGSPNFKDGKWVGRM